MLYILASFGLTFAFWASSVQGSSGIGQGVIGIGEWFTSDFIGVTQDGAGDTITLNEIGTGSYLLSGKYVQMSDIDWNNQAFTPIGLTTAGVFSGEFHGNGYSISNININITETNTAASSYAGLFYRNSGLISRVSLVNASITLTKNTTGDIVENLYLGGIAGENTGSIVFSYVTGTITGTMNRTGSANAQTLNTNTFVGGIAGLNSLNIHNSYSNATISSVANTTTTRNNSTSNANAYAGGLVGMNQGSGNILNTYATGNVTSEAKVSNTGNRANQANALSYAGGLVGHNNAASVSYSFATNTVQARTQTTTTGTATRYFGFINGLGTSVSSYRLSTQSISGFIITPGANGTSVQNTTDSTVTSATQANLRLESFITSNLLWSTEDWMFDTSYYPRLKNNKY
jgi:hypothetical protein